MSRRALAYDVVLERFMRSFSFSTIEKFVETLEAIRYIRSNLRTSDFSGVVKELLGNEALMSELKRNEGLEKAEITLYLQNLLTSAKPKERPAAKSLHVTFKPRCRSASCIQEINAHVLIQLILKCFKTPVVDDYQPLRILLITCLAGCYKNLKACLSRARSDDYDVYVDSPHLFLGFIQAENEREFAEHLEEIKSKHGVIDETDETPIILSKSYNKKDIERLHDFSELLFEHNDINAEEMVANYKQINNEELFRLYLANQARDDAYLTAIIDHCKYFANFKFDMFKTSNHRIFPSKTKIGKNHFIKVKDAIITDEKWEELKELVAKDGFLGAIVDKEDMHELLPYRSIDMKKSGVELLFDYIRGRLNGENREADVSLIIDRINLLKNYVVPRLDILQVWRGQRRLLVKRLADPHEVAHWWRPCRHRL